MERGLFFRRSAVPFRFPALLFPVFPADGCGLPLDCPLQNLGGILETVLNFSKKFFLA